MTKLIKYEMNVLIVLLLLTMTLGGLVQPIVANSSTWDEKMLSFNDYPVNLVAVDNNNNLYAVDVNYASGDTYPYKIIIYCSTNGGATWTQWKSTFMSVEPHGIDIAINLYNNNVYVAFSYSENGYYIYLWRANDQQVFEVAKINSGAFHWFIPDAISITIDYDYGSNNFIYVAYGEYYWDYSDYETSYSVKRATETGLANMVLWKYASSQLSYSYDIGGFDLAIGGDNGDVYFSYYWEYSRYTYLLRSTRSSTSSSFSVLTSIFNVYSEYPQSSLAVSRHSSYQDRILLATTYYVPADDDPCIVYRYSTDGGGTWSSVVYISVNDPDCKVAVTTDGMGTSSNVIGNFYMVYYYKQPGYFEYRIAKASYSNLGSWSAYHTGEYSPLPESIPSISTFQKGHGGWAPVLAYTDSTYDLFVAGDFITLTQPTLSSPSNGYITNDNTPTFSWSSVTGAASYEIQIDNEVSFTSPYIYSKDLIATTSHTLQSPLSDGTYYWRVRSFDSSYDDGPYSSYFSIIIDTTPPAKPTLITPANNYRTSTQVIAFDWSDVTTANYYQIVVYDSGNTKIIDFGTASSTYTSGSLSEDTYSWYVRARDAATNWGAYAGPWYFTIDVTGPIAPTLLSPTSGSTVYTSSTTLDWNDISDAAKYQVQLDTSITFTTLIINTETSLSYLSTGTLAENTYYWRVRSKDDVNNYGSWSSSWYFTYTIPDFSEIPELLSPIENSTITDDRPYFNWTTLAEATSYHYQLSTEIGFSSTILNQTTSDSFWNTSSTLVFLPDNTAYYWRVRAKSDVSLWGSWSETETFIVDTGTLGYSELNYSSFIGGSEWDGGFGIVCDHDDNKWIVGYSKSTDFPTTADAFSNTLSGYHDAFLMKFTPNGSTLLYSTYIGGGYEERAYGIAVDSENNIWIVGYTSSGPPYSPFPTTVNAFNQTHSENTLNDVFLCKFANNGTLLYSTLLGGNLDDTSGNLFIDENDNIWITGATKSFNFPTTSDAFNRTHSNGDNTDIFLSKFTIAGELIYSSYFVSGTLDEYPRSLLIDDLGYLWMCGTTSSTDFYTSSEAINSSIAGNIGGFICKFYPLNNSILYSSILTGSGDDYPLSLSLGSENSIWLCGYTSSTDFPVTSDAYDKSFNGGLDDGFVSKISTDGQLSYSSYIGGSTTDRHDYLKKMVSDQQRNIWIIGTVDSYDFPTTPNALARNKQGTGYYHEIVLIKINDLNGQLLYSSFLGGTHHDYAEGITLDSKNEVWITGYLRSSNFPITSDAYDSTYNDGGVVPSDAYLVGIKLFTVPFEPVNVNGQVIDASIEVTWNNPFHDGHLPISGYQVYRSLISGDYSSFLYETNDNFLIDNNIDHSGTYYYVITAKNSLGESIASEEVIVTIFLPFTSIVELISPINGTELNDNQPHFIWASVPEAEEYKLQIASSSDFISPLIDISSDLTEYSVVLPLADESYYWKVCARNSTSDWSSWSEVWAFTINTHLLSIPSIVYPNTGEVLSGSVLIVWNLATDSNDHSIIYELYYLSPDDNESWFLVVSDLSSNNYLWDTPSVQNGYGFYIKVVAICSEGLSSEDVTDNPLTIYNEYPYEYIVSLLSPIHGSSLNTWNFSLIWSNSSLDEFFQLQISTSESFSTTLINETVFTSSYKMIFPLNDGSYYWRIRARNSSTQWGSWSSIYSFTINTGTSTSTTTTITKSTGTTSQEPTHRPSPGLTLIPSLIFIILLAKRKRE